MTDAFPISVIAPPRARFAEVALDRPLETVYSYSIPSAMVPDLRVGSLVEVPLRKQEARGVVVAINEENQFRGATKPIARILTPDYLIDSELLALGKWISEYYWCTLGEALATVSFVGLNDVHAKMKTHLRLAHADHWVGVSREVGPDGVKVTPKQASVIHALLAVGNEPVAPAELRDDAGVGEAVVSKMLSRGWLARVQEPSIREDDYTESSQNPLLPILTTDQAVALDGILDASHANRHQTFLLHGVTGSGKTEVYLRAIENGLRRGRTAIVLVPEIALTPQTVGNLRARLGRQVGVYHSRLTLGQKYDLWKKIVSGEVRVMIGARSAIFSPMPNLGLIVVDEEHESSYKQGDIPRYHARDVAVWRASRLGAVAILGSATPSLESFHNAREGKYSLLTMPTRIGPHASPAMTVIDMKSQLLGEPRSEQKDGEQRAKNENNSLSPSSSSLKPQAPSLLPHASSLISSTLRDAIQSRLDRGEQTILLLNRRGFANHVLCLKCEKQLECPHCDVALTYHKRPGRNPAHEPSPPASEFQFSNSNPIGNRNSSVANSVERLVCHWCGHTAPVPKKCPKCGEKEIHILGLGTQKVEDILGTMFPAARSIRIDVDSMKGRRTFIEAWERISRREVDIILGTQMIAKGFHLESVTLVGVVSADFALFLPDVRSAERTFQLLTQVAGRAGRGDRRGEVIVQSYLPHHYAIEHAARLDEKGFYEKELHIRKMLRFPPLMKLIALIVTGEDPVLVRDQATRLSNMLKSLARRPAFNALKVLGPAPAPISRLEDQYRWRMLLRGPSQRELHDLLSEGLAAFASVHEKNKVHLTVDVDPVDLL